MAKNTSGNGAGAPQPTAPQARIGYLVARLERTLRQHISAATARYGITMLQYTSLSVLRVSGKLSNAQLARRSFMTPQTMSEVIRAMEERKLISREPDPQHGRVVQISLTRKGEEVLRQCDAAVEQIEAAMLRPLPKSEQASLREQLRACIQALDALRSEKECASRTGTTDSVSSRSRP